MSSPVITCPRCGRTSHHPDDVREGYCAACHDWTSPPPEQVPANG
jgi:ribosomal protein L37E